MALLAALACVALGCQGAVDAASASVAPVALDEIVAEPQRFVGHSITAEGCVDRIVGEQVIALRGQAANQDVLAVVNNPALKAVDSIDVGDTLRIVGAVQMISREQLRKVEQQLGIALDEDKLLGLAKQGPFIVASSIHK